MTTIRRLAAVTIALIIFVTTPIAQSLAGASGQSVVSFGHLGLVDPVAIAAHGKYVWIAELRGNGGNNGRVVRITVATGAQLSITSKYFNHPEALISDGSYVWVVNGSHFGPSHPSISRIDIATNKVGFVTKLPSAGFIVSLAITGRYLWVAGIINGALLRIDRTTLSASTVTRSLFDGDAALSADKSYLWVSSDEGGPLGRGSLARVTLSTGVVKAVNSRYFNGAVSVTSNGTSVWMPASNHVVVKVDIATNKVTTVSSKSFATSLWIGSSSRNVYVLSVYGDPSPPGGALTVIDDATNSLHVVTSKLLTDPMGLAVLGSHVWVISSSTLSSATSPNPNFQLVRVTP